MDTTSNVEGKVETPKVGMIFNTIAEVREYYKRYGDEMGFPIYNRTSKKGDDLEMAYIRFACSRAGKAKPTSSRRTFRMRPFSRTDCKANLSASVCPDGKWRVCSFKHDHNHELSPGKTQWKRKSPFAKRKLGSAEEEDEYKNASFLGSKAGRVKLGQGDASALQSYFKKMKTNNSGFFYVMDFDDEGCMKNVFWADARSRAAYEDFGDAVTFDTTSLANKYATPLAPFTGMNHHGQPTLLGCGLLSGEDTETFNWVFRSFLACMRGCAPKAIITDQDKAVQRALETQLPNTHHRWCLGHILKKLPSRLKGNKQFELIKDAIESVVYDSLTCEEFEEGWKRMVEEYALQSNEWLLGLYEERHRWALPFLKNTFWAGISVPQRGESMVAFFDGYLNSKTSLKQFVERYEKALRSKVEKEYHADINHLNSLVPCITHYTMEKQFQDAYTTPKFKEFQHELRGKMYCELSSAKKEVAYSEYEIAEDLRVGEVDRCVTFKVSLTYDDCGVHCSCCLLESSGILCRHAIAVLIHNKILRVPERYIMPRWRRDLTRRYTRVKISYDDWSGKHEARRFDELCSAFNEVADLSNDSEEKAKMVIDWIHQLKDELKRDEGNILGSSQPNIMMNDGITTTGADVYFPFML